MLIMHAADLHYSAKHLRWVDAAFDFAIRRAIDTGAQAAVISGDSFDSAINVHEPAVTAFFRRVKQLSDAMPVLILQGTASHDRPGSLAPLRTLGPRVLVADHICQAALCPDGWVVSEGPVALIDDIPSRAKAVFSCLPSINKGSVAAAMGAERAAESAGDAVLSVCRSWAGINQQIRSLGIPTILVSHGTVNGCVTETARAMVSPDHEFTSGALFAAQSSATMLGHIHAHQSWQDGRRQIAYPGSLTKLIHGHKGDTGYLLWDVTADGATFQHIPCPSRQMIEAEFDGPPDMNALASMAAEAEGAYVRIRANIDEEHRAAVDRDAIMEMFAAAEEVKIEIRVNPVTRVRAAGISQAPSITDKLRQWCETTGTNPTPLINRLNSLESTAFN